MIRFIAAIDRKRGYRKNGVTPWHLHADLLHFTELTKSFGGRVLMGRMTFEFIGAPLPDRVNFVASRTLHAAPEGTTLVPDAQTFIRQQTEDLWVISGVDHSTQTLLLADELYLTIVDADYDCDGFFPEYQTHFTLVEQSAMQEENGLRFHYEIWRKK